MKPKPASRSDRRPTEPLATAPGAASSPWSSGKRAIVSVLIVLHLAAVFAAPCAGPPPSSELERAVVRLFEPYLHAAFLNHGYRFFAPNPGPSHLVRYELTFSDGKIETGRFPDLKSERPRLLYHRHFMLSETIFSLTRTITDDPPGPGAPPEALAAYEREVKSARDLSQPLLEAVARQLCDEHHAESVKLFVMQHDIPTPDQVLRGTKLSDKSLYREQPLGEWTTTNEWKWAERRREPGPRLFP